jgi:hypothetical protein
MIGAIIAGLASAIPALYKTFSGINQVSKANTGLANLTRPTYNMPEEIARALRMTQQAYADPYMPGQGVMTDRAEQQAANAYAQSKESGNPFAAISQIQANANDQLQNIGVASANYQSQDFNRLLGMLQTVAGYRDTEFQMNKFAPYAEKSQEFRDMLGAGHKNIYGGLDQISGAVGNIGNALMQQSYLNKSMQMQQQNNNALMEIAAKYGLAGATPQTQMPTDNGQSDVQNIFSNLQNATTTDNPNLSDYTAVGNILKGMKGSGNNMNLSSSQTDMLQAILQQILGNQ